MLPLDDPVWAELRQCYGSGEEIPVAIRRLQTQIADGKYSDEELVDLANFCCHQWSTCDGTYAAIPHLIGICQELPPASQPRMDLLHLIGWWVACLRLDQTQASEELIGWFNEALTVARDLTAESLPFVQDDADVSWKLSDFLGAFSALHGDPALAFVLFELQEGGADCGQCGNFIRPLESPMNPFWDENDDT